jgi:RNA polymerase sigma-70 factor (ECF subfamily)
VDGRYVCSPDSIEMVMNEHPAEPWHRQYGSVYRFVRRRASSREEAEDLTQEVFEAAISALGQARLDAGAPPLAWLYTVARRRLIDRFRAPARSGAMLDPAELSGAGDERSYGPSIVNALLEGLRSLDEKQRRVVVMKVFEGRSFAEIAAEVGATEEACRMRLSRGLANLRRQLERRGVTP